MTTYQHKDGMIYDPEDGQTVATMSESATPEQGRMLAAAPELLEALQGLLELVEVVTPIEGDTVRKARAAIRNAT